MALVSRLRRNGANVPGPREQTSTNTEFVCQASSRASVASLDLCQLCTDGQRNLDLVVLSPQPKFFNLSTPWSCSSQFGGNRHSQKKEIVQQSLKITDARPRHWSCTHSWWFHMIHLNGLLQQQGTLDISFGVFHLVWCISYILCGDGDQPGIGDQRRAPPMPLKGLASSTIHPGEWSPLSERMIATQIRNIQTILQLVDKNKGWQLFCIDIVHTQRKKRNNVASWCHRFISRRSCICSLLLSHRL